MDDGYIYNATDEAIANWCAAFTSREGDGGGDFEEIYHTALKLAAACKAGGAFLDVGSGLGRIIDLVKPFATTITGLEPDRDRFQSCQHHFRNDDNIDVINMTTGGFRELNPDARFDFITVSMVVQHVSTRTCQHIFSDVSELLAPGGVGVISTTHFFEERFTYQHDSSPHDVSEYDQYAEDFKNQAHGIPVRMFSKGSFLRAIEGAGLEPVVWQQFSYMRPERLSEMATLYSASPDQVRDYGISQYLLVRRASPSVIPRKRTGILRRLVAPRR